MMQFDLEDFMPKVELGSELDVHAVQAKSSHKRFDGQGRFIPDGRPMQPPIGYRAEPSLMERVREMVRSEQLARDLAAAGVETFEEANDFYIEDDPDSAPSTPYVNDEDTPLEELIRKKHEADLKAAEDERKAREGDDPLRPSSSVRDEAPPPEPLKKARKARQDPKPEVDDGD